MLTLDQLRKAAPLQSAQQLALFLPSLNLYMPHYGIDTPLRQAAFLAQVLHESGQFRTLSENLDYKPPSLLAKFNTSKVTRFTPELAEKYGRTSAHAADQVMIANIAYANRMGNSGIVSGDGWKYRGRGLLQVTGRDNYKTCSLATYGDLRLLDKPELLAEADGAVRSACWFWKANNLNKWADVGDIDGVSDAINMGHKTAAIGDANGFEERMAIYEIMREELA